MNTLQHKLVIDKNKYPLLFTIKKKNLEQTIYRIFETGYKCLYPDNKNLDSNIQNYELVIKLIL